MVTSDVHDEDLAHADAVRRTFAAAVTYYELVDSPRSLGLAIRLQWDGIKSLRDVQFKPGDYLDAVTFARDYGAMKFLSKVRDVVDPRELEDVALSKFQIAERKCASTNVRLFHGNPEGLERILHVARRKISRWIGEVPDIDSIVRRSRWGPGATATLKGDSVRPESKVLEPQLSVTSRLKRFAMACVGRDLHWAKARLDDIDGNIEVLGPCTLLPSEFNPVDWMRVVTVEKDFKTNRTIGAEPTFNTWFQAGIGRELRTLLKRSGTNLDDQRINQSWAELAFSLGLATVDLEAASDSIAYWLVDLLMPPAWFELLDTARSGYAKLPGGKIIALEKFSSMGNGYTFELETLIFRALVESVCEEVRESTVAVAVYGDDIIVPAPAYERLVEVFRVCGFSVNSEKSYSSGLFFESCGEHYFGGARVTPLYQKELLYGMPELVRSHNRFCRWVDRTPAHGRPVHWSTVLKQIRDWAGRGRVPRIPWGYEGDRGFWTTSLEVPWIDGHALLDVLEMDGVESPSVSDAALLAISLRLMDTRMSPANCLQPPDSLGWYSSKSKQCMVPLRGDGPTRVVRRWVPLYIPAELLGDPVQTAGKLIESPDGMTTYTLMPQLRFLAKL